MPVDIALTDLLAEYAIAGNHSEALIDGLDHAAIMWRPHDRSSAIAWHLGHQAAVTHYMVRNLTAAEPSIDPALDALFDSATPEPARGDLPPLDELMAYRTSIARSARRTIERILAGDVGAPEQLAIVASGLLRAVIIHEYQHSTWIAEVRARFTDAAPPEPRSDHLVEIEGYRVLR